MTAYLLTDQLVNLFGPAAAVAMLLTFFSRVSGLFFRSKRRLALSFVASIATIFIVNSVVLAAGLVLFGRDGKMATYAAMVVGAAVTLFVLQPGMKR